MQKLLYPKKFVCEKCGSHNIQYVREDIFRCLDCFHVFRQRWGLAFDQKIFGQYDMAKEYDNFMRTTHIKKFLSLDRDDIFLDVGCGFGYFTLYAGTVVKHATGIDVQSWVLESAEIVRKRLGTRNVVFRQASAYDIPYPDEHFDKVLCAEVLEHLLAPEEALKELARVCRKTLVVQVPTTTFVKDVWEKLFGSEVRDFRDRASSRRKATALPHVQRFNSKSILGLIRSHRFEIVNMVGVRLVPFNLFTNNKLIVNFERFFDVVFGTRFPWSTMGTMTIIECHKNL